MEPRLEVSWAKGRLSLVGVGVGCFFSRRCHPVRHHLNFPVPIEAQLLLKPPFLAPTPDGGVAGKACLGPVWEVSPAADLSRLI